MGVEPGPFQLFYDGPLQHPGLLWAAALAGLAVGAMPARVPAEVRRFVAVLAVLSVADAWLTSNHVLGVGSLPAAVASGVPLFFVLAGDYRYLLVVTSARPGGRLAFSGRSALQAAALTVVVPLSSQVVVAVLPDGVGGSRTLYLVYELSFVLLVLGVGRWHPNARSLPWVGRVSRFVLVYYALWAAADVLILTVGDAGYLLRVVPNVLYYGGLLGAIGWCAAQAAGAVRE